MSEGDRDGDFELITLRSGFRAVRHVGNGEVMHPSVGPWNEALALYVGQSKLPERLSREGQPLLLLDVGLGAATNAVAALTSAAEVTGRKRALHVVSFEIDLAPLRLALADPEGFPFLVPFADACRALIEKGRWERDGLSWTLLMGDALEGLKQAPRPAELVFFDPFSPESNPAMWTSKAFQALHASCTSEGEGTLVTTYSASTRTRASMLLGGFFVGVGAAVGTKKETTVAATRKDQLAAPLDARWLERWRRSTARAPHGEELTAEMAAQIEAHPQFR